MKNDIRRSALVDLVMEDASEAEKAEASEHWFRLLDVLIGIVDEDDKKRRLAGEDVPAPEKPEMPAEEPSAPDSAPRHDAGVPTWKARLYQRR